MKKKTESIKLRICKADVGHNRVNAKSVTNTLPVGVYLTLPLRILSIVISSKSLQSEPQLWTCPLVVVEPWKLRSRGHYRLNLNR